MNNKAILNKFNDLTKVLNKLKQKYGKRKLIQYLKDLDPHLSRPQKKINKIYIRYTRFGTPGSALPRFRKRRRPSETSSVAGLLDLTPAEEPSAEPAAEPAEETRIKINGNEALFFLCATQYYLFKKELSDAIFFSLQYGYDIPYETIFKKYQDVICLLGNIKNVNLTRHIPDNKSSFGSRSGVKRQRDTPVIKLTEIQKYLRGGWLKDTDKINWRKKLKENYRDWSSTSGNTGQTIAWKHTQRQQNAIDNPQKNLTYRCSLCGCYMFDFTNRKHSSCWHSVELEHQIPGSRAVDIYFDVWDTFSTMYPEESYLKNANDQWLYEYEKEFFENIGHQSEIDNIVVYCCTLCNQVKSDMYPYEATDNNKVNLRTYCFNLFMERLETIFTKTVSLTEPHGEWGPVTLKKCDLTYKLQCDIIWTVQFIYTFMMDHQEKLDHTNKTFGGSFMELLPFINNYLQKETAETQRFQKKITPQNIWDIYYNRSFIEDKYFGRPVDNNGKTIAREPAFQSLEEKYASILGTLTNRLRTKFQDDNVTLSENEINLVRSIVNKIFRVRK